MKKLIILFMLIFACFYGNSQAVTATPTPTSTPVTTPITTPLLEPPIKMEPASVFIEYPETSATSTVVEAYMYGWDLLQASEWISISPETGVQGDVITITVNFSQFSEGETREGYVTLINTSTAGIGHVIVTAVYSTATPQPTPVSGSCTIDRLTPLSGKVGTTVLIEGSGFSREENTIYFGPVSDTFFLNQILKASTDETTLSFEIPDYLNPYCYYDNPPCPAPSVTTPPGDYEISVSNGITRSNNVMFTVTGSFPGDVDSNGTVDIIDALMTAQYSVGLNPGGFNPDNADVDCDGSITIVDALLIAQYYVGIITDFC